MRLCAGLKLKTVGKLVIASTKTARKRRTANVARLLEVGKTNSDANDLFDKDCENRKAGIVLSRAKVRHARVVLSNQHARLCVCVMSSPHMLSYKQPRWLGWGRLHRAPLMEPGRRALCAAGRVRVGHVPSAVGCCPGQRRWG